MRRGKGELTYHQLKKINDDLKRQIRNLTAERDKLQADYNSLKIAHKKLLQAQPKPQKDHPEKVRAASTYGSIGIPPAMGFIGYLGDKG